MPEQATNRPTRLRPTNEWKSFSGKESRKWSANVFREGTVYAVRFIEAGDARRALTLERDDTFFPFLFSPVFSLFFFRQMDVELKLKKGGTFGLARLGFPRGNNDPRGTREKRESKRGWRQWTNERDTAERRAQSVYDNSSPIDKLIFLPRISREREKQRESIDRAEIMARTSFEPRFIIY